MKRSCYFLIQAFTLILSVNVNAQDPVFTQKIAGKNTIVSISDLEHCAPIDSMIYGQMLEDCNDAVIYGGVVNKRGVENTSVTKQLEKLRIPVMRWPAGTSIYDYEWRRGVGAGRTSTKEAIWGGTEYYTFGTDEFLAWCSKIGTSPYINIPMGNNNAFTHSLGEALDWVEYVNGSPDSPMGAYRTRNGHKEPYRVAYFCLGNENYLGNKFHKEESADEYAERLHRYASTIKSFFPEVKLLGVGHTGNWNNVVTKKCGEYLDFITMHYYMTATVKDHQLTEPQKTLFAPELVEANLNHFIADLQSYNKAAGRTENPIRLSIDEWNCRHNVFNGTGYSFTRKDDRRLYDAASMASMLNVFIRTSPYVSMANYIFPVNGHGLLKTVGEQDAYPSVCYYIYNLYQKYMQGKAVGVNVTGPGVKDLDLSSLRIDGDTDASQKGKKKDCCYIDCAAVINPDGNLVVALTNRSYDSKQEVRLSVPDGFEVANAYLVSAKDVCAANTEDDRSVVKSSAMTMKSNSVTLNPCATTIIIYTKTQGLGITDMNEPPVKNGLQPYIIDRRIFVEGMKDFSVYTTSGIKVDARAKQSPGIYVVQAGNKSMTVFVE